MTFLFIFLWLAIGSLGSYIGHQYGQKIFYEPLLASRLLLYVVMALAGPVNLIRVLIAMSTLS